MPLINLDNSGIKTNLQLPTNLHFRVTQPEHFQVELLFVYYVLYCLSTEQV